MAIKGRQIARRISREELKKQTAENGDAKTIPGTECQLKLLRTAYDGGFLICNPEGPPEKTIDITIKF